MNISRACNNAVGDWAGKRGKARKAEIYSKISMKFLGGSACTRRTIMHARMLIDTWVERRLGPGARRERSLIMHSFQAAVIILHIAGGGVPRARYWLPLPIFPAWQKRNGRQFGVGHMCARVYTVTLTLLLQFNAFHRQAGLRALKIRARARRWTTAPRASRSSFEFMILGKHLFFHATAPRKRVIEFVSEYIDARRCVAGISLKYFATGWMIKSASEIVHRCLLCYCTDVRSMDVLLKYVHSLYIE